MAELISILYRIVGNFLRGLMFVVFTINRLPMKSKPVNKHALCAHTNIHAHPQN